MTQPPVTGRGSGAEPGRDARLAAFAHGSASAACLPGPDLAVTVAELSGPEWRFDGATDDEVAGLLGRWAALESWAAAGKLGAMREMIRRRALPGVAGNRHGELPDAWEEGLGHEVAAELGISMQAADKLIDLSWDLQARLPGIGAKLADGTISLTKARTVSDEFCVLDDERAAQAEALILHRLAGKTPGQIGKLAAHAACKVDPRGAQQRREHAEREQARVRFWRENGGACALAAFGLPTDEALAANAAINERADEYKKAKIRPDAKMDQLRVLAFLDILNGVTAATRIARAQAEAAQGHAAQVQAAQVQAGHSQAAHSQAAQDGTCLDSTGATGPDSGNAAAGDDAAAGDGGAADDGPADDGPADDTDGEAGDEDPGSGPGNGPGPDGGNGPNGGGISPACGQPAGPALPIRGNLTIPLVTLLHLAERPGDAYGLGPLDPALARDLAATAARSPRSEWCVTVTDPDGIAIGHGCAKPARASRANSPPGSHDGPWAFTPRDNSGSPDGYGTWVLTLPGGRKLEVNIGQVPVLECDHRHESHSYQPSETLRHLVQVRDGQCTFPPCSRHARESDFEHATPYAKGGKTCACNAGARSRKCHKVKQSRGWKVRQPRPGWHEWTTPSGRTYTQGPMQYPA